jgi:hypothetical protein
VSPKGSFVTPRMIELECTMTDGRREIVAFFFGGSTVRIESNGRGRVELPVEIARAALDALDALRSKGTLIL